MEERIVELELRFMHQEKSIQELNEVVSRQELVIELLKREISDMKEQSLQMSPGRQGDAEQEKPPHY